MLQYSLLSSVAAAAECAVKDWRRKKKKKIEGKGESNCRRRLQSGKTREGGFRFFEGEKGFPSSGTK